jgi:hypothetical protein
VAELPRFAGGDRLFSTTAGRRPISGFSKFRKKFNETLSGTDAKASGRPRTRGRGHPTERADLIAGYRRLARHEVNSDFNH